eukprot:RCo040997
MGNENATPRPRPAPVVLVPPLFDRTRHRQVLPRKLTQSPFEYLFGENELRGLFSRYILDSGGLRFAMAMQPTDLVEATPQALPWDPTQTFSSLFTVRAKLRVPSAPGLSDPSVAVTPPHGSVRFLWETVGENPTMPVVWTDFRLRAGSAGVPGLGGGVSRAGYPSVVQPPVGFSLRGCVFEPRSGLAAFAMAQHDTRPTFGMRWSTPFLSTGFRVCGGLPRGR